VREPELPEGSLTAINGAPGCGKSTLVQAWCGEASTVRSVLILDRENPAAIIAERYGRLGIATDNTAIKHWGGWLPDEAPPPSSAIVWDWTTRCDPKPLIVIDSMSAFLDGNENDAGEVRAFLHPCRRLADQGATVIVVHHDGKAETAKDYRGSSDFKAAIDAGFHVTNHGPDGRLGTVRLRCFKSRFGFAGEMVYHYDNGVFRPDYAPLAAARSMTQQLSELLAANSGIKVAQFEKLAIEKGISRDRVRQFVKNDLCVRRVSGPYNATLLHPATGPSSEMFE
jgi:KaiC/GvpD/RAD55 family RecA-like ATPase